MTKDFLIDVSSYNRTLNLIDSTDYELVQPGIRDDFGIAVFISERQYDLTYVDDPTLADLSNPGEIDSPGEWDITIPNTTTNYLISMFWAPLWDNGGIYVSGDIVYYEVVGTTGFWINGTGANDTPDPLSANWTELTTADVLLFEAALSGNVERVQYDVDTLEAPIYMVKFAGCDGSHYLIDNSGNTNPKRYSIETSTGDTVVDNVVFTSTLTSFTLTGDNVYIIRIEEEISGNYVEVASLPIYEYCKLKTCTTYLINSILCNEYDPCCDNCDEETQLLKEKQRFTLNELIALYGSFMAYIHEEYINYLGITSIDSDRMDFITNIQQLLDKIEEILERCELCQGAWQESTTTTNNGSSYKPCNCH